MDPELKRDILAGAEHFHAGRVIAETKIRRIPLWDVVPNEAFDKIAVSIR